MRLHDVKVGKNRFCGPAALSAITGRPVDEIVMAFHATFPDKKVMGTHGWELRRVLNLYGPSLWVLGLEGKPTLAKWLKDNKAKRTPGNLFLLAAGNHWVVVSGRRIVCGKVKKVMSVRAYPHRRARVTEAFLVTGDLQRGVPGPVKAHKALKAKKAAESARRSNRLASARRLAKEHGIEIEREGDHWLVWPPDGFSQQEGDGLPEDPYEGDHLAWDPTDVEERVAAYVEAARAVNCTATAPPDVAAA